MNRIMDDVMLQNPYIKEKHLNNKSFLQYLFPSFRFKSFNFIFCSFLSIYYVANLILTSKETSFKGCISYNMGAIFTADIQYRYQFYRFLSSIFLFSGIINFIATLITLLMFGFEFEKIQDWKVIIHYINGGFFAGLLTAIGYSLNVTVCNQGMTFMLIFYKIFDYYTIYQRLTEQKLMIAILIIIITSNLFCLISSHQLNIAAAAGGAIYGILIWVYTYYGKQQQEQNQISNKLRQGCKLIGISYIFLMFSLLYGVERQNIDISKFC